MLAGTRHQRILMRLSEVGEASITELAALLDVSGDTIRRDLVKLDSEGLLHKTHGGAIALDLEAMPRISRNRLLPDVKTALGKAVGAAIPRGTTIMLDAGMTALAVARAIDVAATGLLKETINRADEAISIDTSFQCTRPLQGSKVEAKHRWV